MNKSKDIKVLSFPSRHPYTSKLNTDGIRFVNPDTDLFASGITARTLDTAYPSETYDIAHIHFSYDQISLDDLEEILKYFKGNKKPVIWTLHSKESQRIRNYGNGNYQKLLFEYADQIVTPTHGAKNWCESVLGRPARNIEVIPLGFMADPRDIEKLEEGIKKDPKLFAMLIGEFRQNKDFIQSIVNFLQCTELSALKLLLIFKPIPLLNDSNEIRPDMAFFYSLLNNSRIEVLSKPWISNEEINIAFLRSHAIIIPYRWGTHSGQIEHAKDCGCNVVASSVGFYAEQLNGVCLYEYNETDPFKTAINYTNALIEVANRPSLNPAGRSRLIELDNIIALHLKIYNSLLSEASK